MNNGTDHSGGAPLGEDPSTGEAYQDLLNQAEKRLVEKDFSGSRALYNEAEKVRFATEKFRNLATFSVSWGIARTYALEHNGLTEVDLETAKDAHHRLRMAQTAYNRLPPAFTDELRYIMEAIEELLSEVWCPVSAEVDRLSGIALDLLPKDPESAETYLREAIALDLREDCEGSARAILGRILRERGQFEEARLHLRQALNQMDRDNELAKLAQDELRWVEKGSTEPAGKRGCLGSTVLILSIFILLVISVFRALVM